MVRGGRAAIVASVIAIIILTQLPLGLSPRGPSVTSSGGTPATNVAALGARDTPENPGGSSATGANWAPWILLGVAAATVAAGYLVLVSFRRRKPRARFKALNVALPEAAVPDGLPDDWPQL